MSNKKILYYTQACYLDITLEYVQLLSQNGYSVDLLIELPPTKLQSNILNLSVNLQQYKALTSYNEVMQDWGIEFMQQYFANCNSVNFVIYKTTNSITELLKVTSQLKRFISNRNPDYIHFDDLSPRQAILLALLWKFRNKFVLNVHDPKPHIGEFEWKRQLLKKVTYKWINSYVVFSDYSFKEFKSIVPADKNVFVIKLMPYTVFQHFISHNEIFDESGSRPIVFVGRISPYKGVNLLVEAINIVWQQLPNQKFIIAGKAIEGYNLDSKTTANPNLNVIDKHLSNNEIANIVNTSQLVVCPYLEATQSGVIMTAFALDTPVMVTNVGGLPEYIDNNVSGLIVNQPNAAELGEKLIRFVKEGLYKTFKSNIYKARVEEHAKAKNLAVVKKLYA